MGHTPLDLHSGSRYLTELKGVIGWRVNCLCQVFAHLVLVNIKSSHEIDVADVVSPEVNVHQPGYKFGLFSILIVMDTLDQ
ncbi:hypothetical protein ES703_52562 [subsurface metagenome]